MKQYQYLNILIVGALVIYLAYQLYVDMQSGNTGNITLRVVVLVFGVGVLVFRIIQLKKHNNRQ